MRFLALLTSCLLLPFWLGGQPTYYMSNQTVDDCEGILFDSEAGDVAGNYDHNENLTFSICVPGADQIVLTFQSFCTEELFDSLRVFDGPDTLSLQLGSTYFGEPDPPTLVATSGCLTINFISDPSVSCTGWVAEWETIVAPPVPPDILPLANLPCESTTLTVEFADPLPCDSLYAGAFSISGPLSPAVVQAQPNNCSGGFATSVTLTLASPIDFSGNYTVTFVNTETICEEVYILEAIEPFAVTDCPLNVVLQLLGQAVCAGDTALLWAEASGGDPSSYAFQWAPVFSPNEFALVTPLTTTTYYVTVSDANGAMASDSITLSPFPLPQILQSDTSLCTVDQIISFSATPPGGLWSGSGVPPGQEASGQYNPALSLFSQDTLTYTDLNGCSSQIYIDLLPVDPGPDEAACPGSNPFFVEVATPAGGIWSGAFIQPDGSFTPPDSAGVFEVFYTAPNGCVASKEIIVDTLLLPDLDTLCQSVGTIFLNASPANGQWNGMGILNSDSGEFDPYQANVGDNLLEYQINGCADTLSLHILQIDALWNLSACPEQDPFILPGNWQPAGIGVWSGQGILDPITGLYDPSVLPHGVNDTLTFSANGCTDTRIVFVRQTLIGQEFLEFCPEDPALELIFQTTGNVPCCGVWSGPGITNPQDDDYFFNPNLAGSGSHLLFYERNTCVDSMVMTVFPTPAITPISICEAAAPVVLNALPPNGVWSGPGIVDANLGIFDPGQAGVGIHTVTNVSTEGCAGSADLEVTPIIEATIEGLDGFYCFRDTTLTPILSPAGGVFTIDGIPATALNPAQAGPGTHILQYTAGAAECQDTETFVIQVGPPISVSLPVAADSLCPGESIFLTALATGGSPQGPYLYTWDQGLGFGQSQYANPAVTTTYTVLVEDGCSDPGTASVAVLVFPPITASYITGPPVCFDDTTFAEVFAAPGDDFSFSWNTSPPATGNYLEGRPATYLVEVTQNETGCQTEITVELPGYDLIDAQFIFSENVPCINTLDPTIGIIDLSVGGTNGYWDFGDNTAPLPYFLGQEVGHTYRDTGTYLIQLYIENEGGCPSYFEREICVEFANRLFAPNAFSPNGDGINENFRFKGIGITSLDYQIFNRYGELIFRGDDLYDVWDGHYKGQRVQQGVYTVVAVYTVEGSDEKRSFKGFVTVLH